MPYFKNTQNDLFWLDEGENAAHWLPGCTPISNEEAEVMKQAKQAEWLAKEPSKEQIIAQLEEQINILKAGS